MTEAQENGYIECGECGHPVEQHAAAGCDIPECTCDDRWTESEIRKARKREGLSAEWKF